MKITEKQILKNSHISSETIRTDILETQIEIDRFEKEIIRINEEIADRKDFIETLNFILAYREINKKGSH